MCNFSKSGTICYVLSTQGIFIIYIKKKLYIDKALIKKLIFNSLSLSFE
jgi:hypothetical protein